MLQEAEKVGTEIEDDLGEIEPLGCLTAILLLDFFIILVKERFIQVDRHFFLTLLNLDGRERPKPRENFVENQVKDIGLGLLELHHVSFSWILADDFGELVQITFKLFFHPQASR